MNELIWRLAREAGFPYDERLYLAQREERLVRFAALVAEQCAQTCETVKVSPPQPAGAMPSWCAQAIRYAFAMAPQTQKDPPAHPKV